MSNHSFFESFSRFLPASALSLSMLGLSSIAGAQEVSDTQDQSREAPRENTQASQSSDISAYAQLDTFLFTGDASRAAGIPDAFNWANLLSGGVDLGTFGARVWVPFAYGSGGAGGGGPKQDGFMLGNITLEGFYDLELSRASQLRVLARLALPTSTSDSNLGTAVAAGLSGAVTFWDPRYWPAGVVTPGIGAEYSLTGDAYLFNAMATADVLIGTKNGQNTDFVTQASGSFALRLGRAIDVGAKVMAGLNWGALGRAGQDAGSVGLEPFIQTDPGLDLPVYGRLGFIMNLDNDNGPTFESGRIWGAHLTVGAQF